MPKHGPASDLLEIEAALKKIQSYIAGLGEAAFTASLITYDTVAINLIVIGEAVNRIDPAVLQQEPNIPWKLVIGQRNRQAHGYEDIEPAWLWRTVSQELTPFQDAIARLLARHLP